MKENRQLTEQELDDISGGPHYTDFGGKARFMCRGIIVPDYKVRGAPKGNTVGIDVGPVKQVRGCYGV